jgi:hypothetical protein
MQEEAVRWNIKVSKETDLALRTYLGSQGMKRATSRSSSKKPFAGAFFIARCKGKNVTGQKRDRQKRDRRNVP